MGLPGSSCPGLPQDPSRSSTEFFGGRDLFGRLAHKWEIHEQFFCFEEQEQRLTKLHEIYMVDLPTFDHSRLPFVRASASFAGSKYVPAQTRVVAPLASLAPNPILEI
jgi:hypothetical protein